MWPKQKPRNPGQQQARRKKLRVIPILRDTDSSWHHGQSPRRTGNYLKLNNDFAFDRCTVARLEESASPRVGISSEEIILGGHVSVTFGKMKNCRRSIPDDASRDERTNCLLHELWCKEVWPIIGTTNRMRFQLNRTHSPSLAGGHLAIRPMGRWA